MTRPLLVVLRPLGLGDFLTGIPAYRALARRFPAHVRLLAAPRALHDLVPATYAFDGAVDVEPLVALPRSLHFADVAVDLHGRGPASQEILLAAQPRRLFSFANAALPATAGGPAWDPAEHEVARWCRMVEAFGARANADDLRLAVPADVPAPRAGATIVHPGAASVSRCWPPERWARVIAALRARGHDVVVTGTRAERPLARALAPAHDATGTTLRDLSALVAAARLVISGDTGIAHLAVAHATPTVTLFGPTSPAAWGPPDRPRHRVLWAGRTGDPHARVVDPGLLAIGVEDVVAAIDRVVAATMPVGSAALAHGRV